MTKSRKTCKGWKIGGALAVAAACAIGVYVGTTVYAEESTDRVIAENIYIGDIAVGGMTEVEANEAVDAYVESLGDTQFTLTVDDKSVVATAEDFGVTWSNRVLIKDALDVGKIGRAHV